MFTILQLETQDGWPDVLLIAMAGCDDYKSANRCSSFLKNERQVLTLSLFSDQMVIRTLPRA